VKRFVVGITGASGSRYAIRLLEVLMQLECEVHLTISPAAVLVLNTETDRRIDLNSFRPADLLGDMANGKAMLKYHHFTDFMTGIASGSFKTDAMVICPCSMGTLSSIAHGLSSNLIQRAADVHIKERRKLVVVPRETPLGPIQLQNMLKLTQAGAVVLPAMPGFYHAPQTIDDLVDFVVGRICDQLDIDHSLQQRWGESS
jgi:4-hydroxy-3-polyprenylbenzoate decarboxylase